MLRYLSDGETAKGSAKGSAEDSAEACSGDAQPLSGGVGFK